MLYVYPCIFIYYPVPYVLCPVPCVLYLVPCVSCPLPCVLCPVPCNMCTVLLSCTMWPVSNVNDSVSDVLYSRVHYIAPYGLWPVMLQVSCAVYIVSLTLNPVFDFTGQRHWLFTRLLQQEVLLIYLLWLYRNMRLVLCFAWQIKKIFIIKRKACLLPLEICKYLPLYS